MIRQHVRAGDFMLQMALVSSVLIATLGVGLSAIRSDAQLRAEALELVQPSRWLTLAEVARILRSDAAGGWVWKSPELQTAQATWVLADDQLLRNGEVTLRQVTWERHGDSITLTSDRGGVWTVHLLPQEGDK